jgi:hypothetical protein
VFLCMGLNGRKKRAHLKHSRSFENRGFVLPLVIGLGLMIILIGLTLFLRSQNAQISATARQDTAQGLSAAESGVTLAQAFIDRRRFLADDDSGTATSTTGWVADLQTRDNTYQSYVGTACPEIANAKTTAVNYLGGTATPTLFPLANNAGKFRIVNYDYQPSPVPAKGVLTIEGAPEQSNAVVSSLARVRVEIPLDANSPVPALWASNFNLANDNVIGGNIRAYACPVGSGSTGSSGANIVSETNVVLNAGDLKVDPYQRLPDTLNGPTSGDGVYTLTSAISGSFTLPRAGDSVDVDANGVYDNVDYHYRFSGVSSNQITANTIITIDGTKISPGKSVNLYPDSNLDLSGVTTLVTGGTPGQRYLRILGRAGTTAIQIDGATSLGNPNLIVLVHGPRATATLSTAGTGGSGITGSLWVKSVAAATVPAVQKIWVTGCPDCSWNNIAPSIPSTQISSPVRLSSVTAWIVCSRDADTSGLPTNDWERPNTDTAGGADLACNGS